MKNCSRWLYHPKSLVLLTVLLSAVFWVMDSVVDVWVFDHGESLIDNLIQPTTHELWMRITVVLILIAFALFSKKMLNIHLKITEELNQYKDHLEKLVDERTHELQQSNQMLSEEILEQIKIQKQLEQMAKTDPLTDLVNRRKFEELMDYEVQRIKQYQTGLSFIFCDIDHFKEINDEYGHDIGDRILKEFAALLQKHTRSTDIVARWGGEEFILLIPNMSTDNTRIIAEHLRKKIEQHSFSKALRVTASFGVTHFSSRDNINSVIKRADKALYQAKNNGRNRVEVQLENL